MTLFPRIFTTNQHEPHERKAAAMTTKSIFRIAALCLLMAAIFACASGGSKKEPTAKSGGQKTEPTLENADIAVFQQLGHSGIIRSVTFSPDGKHLFSCCWDYTTILWDVENGREIRTFEGNFIAFSSDVKRLITDSMNRTIKLWDVESGREIKTYEGKTRFIEFSPDGKQIIFGYTEKFLKLWDATTGQEIRTLKHSDDVTSAAFSPDGKYILSGSWNTVKLWDLASGQEIRNFSGQTKSVDFVAFSPDGKRFLSSSYDKNRTVKLWDVASGIELRTFLVPDDRRNMTISTHIVFSPDGKQILSCFSDNTLKLWDTATGQEIKTFSGHTDYVISVAFSPDGKQILSGSADNTVKQWDVASGQEIRTKGWYNRVISVAFSPDGKRILCDSGRSGTRLWDAVSGQEIRRIDTYAIAFSLDGQQVVYGGNAFLYLLDAVSGQGLRLFTGPSEAVTCVAISHDGKQVLTGSKDTTIRLWDVESGRMLRTYRGRHSYGISSVAFSPDGKQFLSSSHADRDPSQDTVILWNVESGSQRGFHLDDTVNSVVFSPDGKQILSCSGTTLGNDYSIKLWNTADHIMSFFGVHDKDKIKTFPGCSAWVISVAFSPDGKQIIAGLGSYGSSDGITVKLWDVASGREVIKFSGHKYSVISVAFSPDGKQFLSSSDTVKLCDTATGQEIRTISDGYGHVAFSPDGKQILSCSENNTLKLWDKESGQEIRTFSGHSAGISSFAISPDGTRIVTGSSDGTARLWDVATGKEIVKFISFFGNNIQVASASRGLTVETETAVTSNIGEWLSITPDNYYQASPRGDSYINVRVNNTVSGIDSYRSIFYNPDVVLARLQGKPDPASKSNITIQDVAKYMPPEVTIQSPVNLSATNSKTTNLSVNITSQLQPVKNIKIIVNGRLLGKDELAKVTGTGLQAQKASLTVTGNQKTVNLSLPIELDPGNNRIEVVAFNGYTENRRYIDVTRNAPAGEKPPLPNLWIVAIGVNGYDNAGEKLQGLKNLNCAVADAKGLVDSLKEQEGKRYGKVNAMLIADGEAQEPNTANIRQGFKFLEGADPRRDVVILFLAGHGISAQEGKFFFLPKDAVFKGDRIVDASKAISGDEIMTVLDAPGNRLVFIDACQTGGVDNDRMVRSLMDTNAFVFTASRGYEPSLEDPKLGHGYFTYSVMSALKGAPAALSQGSVSVLSMSGYVKDVVPKMTGGKQNPSAYSLGFYDFPVADIK